MIFRDSLPLSLSRLARGLPLLLFRVWFVRPRCDFDNSV